jgi:hypothetical protein
MRRTILLIIASALALAACGKPVPPEKAAYVGEWRAQSMALLITQDGQLSYKRVRGNTSTSVNGPVQFEGDNFVVGVLFLKTKFEVSKPPFEQAGRWKMVVDGVELTKAQ